MQADTQTIEIASKQAGRQASRQAVKQESKQASMHASKLWQASKHTDSGCRQRVGKWASTKAEHHRGEKK
eukprot:1891162-Alexandrium_andersonii.AAC.1